MTLYKAEEDDSWISPWTGETMSFPKSGNAWTSALEEATPEIYSRPEFLSLPETTRTEGESPDTISDTSLSDYTSDSFDASKAFTNTDADLSVTDSFTLSNEIVDSATNNQDFSKQSAWSKTKDAAGNVDWGARAQIIGQVATHAAKLVSILDGSWAESQKKIIGMGKYHGPGRAWWA